MMNSKLFTPASIGPLTLRNRTIRSAAFESMCPGNAPSRQLKDYHCSVAAGGVGMTTIAYAAVTQSGLSFDRQLWMRPEIIPGLREITDAVHKEGAAKHSVGTLWKYVAQKYLWGNTHRSFFRF
jgi:NADH:flavin oxidoreductases, Old Yellow Enzyme family